MKAKTATQTHIMISWDELDRLTDVVSAEAKRTPKWLKIACQARVDAGMRAVIYSLPAELTSSDNGFGFGLLPLYWNV